MEWMCAKNKIVIFLFLRNFSIEILIGRWLEGLTAARQGIGMRYDNWNVMNSQSESRRERKSEYLQLPTPVHLIDTLLCWEHTVW